MEHTAHLESRRGKERTEPRAFVVRETLGPGIELSGIGTGLSMDGLLLDTPGDAVGDRRFLWMEFGLADLSEGEGERIRALGEITERSDVGLRVRFKHLFPDHRKKLAIYLDREGGMRDTGEMLH